MAFAIIQMRVNGTLEQDGSNAMSRSSHIVNISRLEFAEFAKRLDLECKKVIL